jgi:hypothetical protein
MDDWTLPRRNGGVRGHAFRGTVTNIGPVSLDRELLVLGFNHNIQSSFGVTRSVKSAISNWIASAALGTLS